MKLIACDTETTGLSFKNGDRIIEIACVIIDDHIIHEEFKSFHTLINPERNIPIQATRIHGITDKMVKDKPIFSQIIDDFLEYIQDATLVIHNATFDIGFLNFELSKIGKPQLQNQVIDSLTIARSLFPNTSNTLDALCNRFKISLSKRSKHGALIDTQLLAQVYLQLVNCSQKKIKLESNISSTNDQEQFIRPARKHKNMSKEEQERHTEFILNKLKVDIW